MTFYVKIVFVQYYSSPSLFFTWLICGCFLCISKVLHQLVSSDCLFIFHLATSTVPHCFFSGQLDSACAAWKKSSNVSILLLHDHTAATAAGEQRLPLREQQQGMRLAVHLSSSPLFWGTQGVNCGGADWSTLESIGSLWRQYCKVMSAVDELCCAHAFWYSNLMCN